MTIPQFPHVTPIRIDMRNLLHERLMALTDGLSEQSFANLFLFRRVYKYQVTMFPDASLGISGVDGDSKFWIFPEQPPAVDILQQILIRGSYIKAIPKRYVSTMRSYETRFNYVLTDDRDNYDYLYLRDDLAHLHGRKFHKKRNLLNYFQQHYRSTTLPLGAAQIDDAHVVLDAWLAQQTDTRDYLPTKDALQNIATLNLCGYITYIDEQPSAFALGEGLAQHAMFVIHFEKALTQYKGIYQYLNNNFAAYLPKHYHLINREQDLGEEGLRQAKMTYRPHSFTKKYRFAPKGSIVPTASQHDDS